MKKVVIFAIALLLSVANMYAQNVSIGVKGGLSIPNLTTGGKEYDTPVSEGYASRMAAGGGIVVDFHLTKIFAIQTGLEYSGQGGKKKGVQALPGEPIFEDIKGSIGMQPGGEQLVQIFETLQLPPYVYADCNSVAKFNYIMLPVQAKFGWKLSETPWKVYVTGGIFGSYLLSTTRELKGTSAMYADNNKTSMSNYWSSISTSLPLPPEVIGAFSAIFAGMDMPQPLDGKENMKDDINPFNFGVIGSVGLSYNISGRNRIFLEGGGNYGFNKLQKDDMNGRNRIGAGTVMLGISRTLRKNKS